MRVPCVPLHAALEPAIACMRLCAGVRFVSGVEQDAFVEYVAYPLRQTRVRPTDPMMYSTTALRVGGMA